MKDQEIKRSGAVPIGLFFSVCFFCLLEIRPPRKRLGFSKSVAQCIGFGIDFTIWGHMARYGQVPKNIKYNVYFKELLFLIWQIKKQASRPSAQRSQINSQCIGFGIDEDQ